MKDKIFFLSFISKIKNKSNVKKIILKAYDFLKSDSAKKIRKSKKIEK